MAAGMVEKAKHLWAYHGIDGIVGAKHHDVVGVDLRIDEVELVVAMVFVEEVFGIIVLVEEGQRDGRLALGVDIDVFGVDMVVVEKLDDVLSHTVVARLADERGIDARPSERDDAIEHGAARHGSYGLLVLEDDVEHGFSDSYNFAHDFQFRLRLQI